MRGKVAKRLRHHAAKICDTSVGDGWMTKKKRAKDKVIQVPTHIMWHPRSWRGAYQRIKREYVRA